MLPVCVCVVRCIAVILAAISVCWYSDAVLTSFSTARVSQSNFYLDITATLLQYRRSTIVCLELEMLRMFSGAETYNVDPMSQCTRIVWKTVISSVQSQPMEQNWHPPSPRHRHCLSSVNVWRSSCSVARTRTFSVDIWQLFFSFLTFFIFYSHGPRNNFVI